MLKPSEITPLTALKLAEAGEEYLPAGVINLLFGRGKTVGNPLTGHPKVRMVSLTALSPPQARSRHTASSIKRTHMELGGEAQVPILFDDADIEAVVEGVRTFGYYNAGQNYTALVEYTRKKAFTDCAGGKTGCCGGNVKIWCAPDDESTELGPLSSLAHLERVSKAVEEAKRQGAWEPESLGGEKRKGNGYYYAPTLLAGAYRTMPSCKKRYLVRWSVSPFDNEEQVVNWANLTASTCILVSTRVAGASRRRTGCDLVILGQYPFHAGK